MKIVVIGGTGLIGSRVVAKLDALGHEAVAASLDTGVNTLTGEGLAAALTGAHVVIDVSNSPSFEEVAVMNFFKTSTSNLLAYEANAGVVHHVLLSVVGSNGLPESAYLRAKVAQEKLIKDGPIPYSIIYSTQFFEFGKRIADEATTGKTVRLPPVHFQPIAADDVVSEICTVATNAPLNGSIDIAGPESFRFDEFIRLRLKALDDKREVIADPEARYFGAALTERSIVPGEGARLGKINFNEWLKSSAIPSSVNPKTNEFRISDVPAGSAMLAGDAAVFNVGGTLCATQAKCTHRQGPLSKGKLEGSTVTCPIHGAQFNVCTGEVLRGPAKDPLQTYRVVVEGEVGRIDIDEAQKRKSANA